MPKISVIVSVYKVERYLQECLDSIIHQTYSDLEIILVDDGSPDGCPDICDGYAKIDNRIRVIHQENQGVVCARQNGLMIAQGEYISFIDGDDWLEPNMYEIMIQPALNKAIDIVVAGYSEDCNSTTIDKKNNIASGFYEGSALDEIRKKIMYFGSYYEPGIIPALWNKLFRKRLVLENPLEIHSSIKLGEDAFVSYTLLSRANTIVINNELHAYHYRIVANSMSRVCYDEMFFERALLLLNGLKDSLKDDSMLMQLVYYGLFISQIGIEKILSRNCRLTHADKKQIIEQYHTKFVSLFADDQILWDEFDDYKRKLMYSFVKGDIDKLMRINKLHRIRRRIGSLR